MEETANLETEDAAYYKTEIEKLFAQMQILREQMQRDHERFDRLKAETQVIQANNWKLLAKLQER